MSTPNPAIDLGVGVAPPLLPGEQYAEAISEGEKLANTLQQEHNTANMIAAGEAQKRQDRIDQINEALRTGNINEIRRLSSF